MIQLSHITLKGFLHLIPPKRYLHQPPINEALIIAILLKAPSTVHYR